VRRAGLLFAVRVVRRAFKQCMLSSHVIPAAALWADVRRMVPKAGPFLMKHTSNCRFTDIDSMLLLGGSMSNKARLILSVELYKKYLVILICMLINSVCYSGILKNGFPAAVSWGACADISNSEFQCASLKVPLDYANPAVGTTTLEAMKYTKSGATPSDTLFFNDGGPWDVETRDLPIYIAYLDPGILARYAIVTFDPRGVGQSSGLSCQTALDGSIANADAMSTQGVEALVQQYRQKWVTCASQYHDFQNSVGTNNTVQDVDFLKQGLGVDKISFLAYSYGTQLGSLYLSSYPSHVESVVLDSVVMPSRDFRKLAMDHGAAYEDTLNNFFAQCDANPACPIYPHSQKAYDQAMKTLSAHNVPTGVSTYTMPLTLTGFLTAVEDSLLWTNSDARSVNSQMFEPDMWANDLAQGVADINKNDGTVMMKVFLDNSGYDPATGTYGDNSIYSAVLCSDFDNHPSDDVIVQDAAFAREAYPRIGGFVVGMNLPMCSGWSRTSTNPPLPVLQYSPSTPKILLSCNDHDPATPLSWCQDLGAEIPNSVKIVWSGAGHCVYLSNEPPGTCVQNKVNAYLERGIVPGGGMSCDDTFNPTTSSSLASELTHAIAYRSR